MSKHDPRVTLRQIAEYARYAHELCASTTLPQLVADWQIAAPAAKSNASWIAGLAGRSNELGFFDKRHGSATSAQPNPNRTQRPGGTASATDAMGQAPCDIAFSNAKRLMPLLAGRLCIGVLAAVYLCGCSFGPSRVEVPQLDPALAASAAVEQYDSDQDQNISASEAAACPGLAGSFKLYDANQDGQVSQAEVESRLKAMLGSGIGRMPCMVVVYAGDSQRPIEGAKVRVVPESFLDGAIQAGEGVTNARGIAKPVTIGAPPGLPGIELGLYRVEITHDSLKIPDQYNSKTELGFELSPLERNRDTFEFRLKMP